MEKGFNKYLNHFNLFYLYVSFVQSCFLISSVIFSVLNDDYPGGSHCGVATLRTHFLFPGYWILPPFCELIHRASVLRSAKKFFLKGMCNHFADLCRLFSKLSI